MRKDIKYVNQLTDQDLKVLYTVLKKIDINTNEINIIRNETSIILEDIRYDLSTKQKKIVSKYEITDFEVKINQSFSQDKSIDYRSWMYHRFDTNYLKDCLLFVFMQ